jgi:dihydrofolate reductase
MRISLIAAMSSNRVIGKDNKLPWDLPTDLNFFKSKTLNSIIIMGRKTYESMGRPLPKRKSIVISRSKKIEGVDTVASLDEAVQKAKTYWTHEPYSNNDIYIIGGAQIYELSLNCADRIYLTEIHKAYDGDAFFPEFSKEKFKETERKPCTENGIDFDFVTYDKL